MRDFSLGKRTKAEQRNNASNTTVAGGNLKDEFRIKKKIKITTQCLQTFFSNHVTFEPSIALLLSNSNVTVVGLRQILFPSCAIGRPSASADWSVEGGSFDGHGVG